MNKFPVLEMSAEDCKFKLIKESNWIRIDVGFGKYIEITLDKETLKLHASSQINIKPASSNQILLDIN